MLSHFSAAASWGLVPWEERRVEVTVPGSAARVHAGVHYPGDVVAGALLGTALIQLTTHALDRRTTDRR